MYMITWICSIVTNSLAKENSISVRQAYGMDFVRVYAHMRVTVFTPLHHVNSVTCTRC